MVLDEKSIAIREPALCYDPLEASGMSLEEAKAFIEQGKKDRAEYLRQKKAEPRRAGTEL